MSGLARLLDGLKILVVEDDFLVAVALVAALERAGAVVVGPIAWTQEALMLVDQGHERIDAAILDVDLNGEKSYPVADALSSRGIRFIFATGYGADAVDKRYRYHPRCQKPYDHHALFRTLAASAV